MVQDAGEAPDAGVRERYAAQHRALREIFERTRAHAALSLVANPPHMPIEPPLLGADKEGRRAPPSMHVAPAPLAGADADEDDEEDDDEEETQPEDAVLISLEDFASAPVSGALLDTPLSSLDQLYEQQAPAGGAGGGFRARD